MSTKRKPSFLSEMPARCKLIVAGLAMIIRARGRMVSSRVDWRLAAFRGMAADAVDPGALDNAYARGIMAARGTRSEWTARMPIDSKS